MMKAIARKMTLAMAAVLLAIGCFASSEVREADAKLAPAGQVHTQSAKKKETLYYFKNNKWHRTKGTLVWTPYVLVKKNGKVVPCNSKGKQIGDYFGQRHEKKFALKKVYVAPNVKKLDNPMHFHAVQYKYNFKVVGNWKERFSPRNPIAKSLEFLTKRGKNSCAAISDDFFVGRVKSIKNLEKTEVKTIGSCAFTGVKIKKLKLPKTVETIGDEAFKNCKKLASVDLSGADIAAIGDEAFKNCRKLASFDLSKTKVETIGYEAFKNCASLKSVTLPESLKTIGNGCFEGCSSLESVTLLSPVVVEPESCLDKEDSVFGGAKAVYVPASLLSQYADTSLDEAGNPVNDWYYCAHLFKAL